jgi:hypothetical protein
MTIIWQLLPPFHAPLLLRRLMFMPHDINPQLIQLFPRVPHVLRRLFPLTVQLFLTLLAPLDFVLDVCEQGLESGDSLGYQAVCGFLYDVRCEVVLL